jgi:hypothetical protein
VSLPWNQHIIASQSVESGEGRCGTGSTFDGSEFNPTSTSTRYLEEKGPIEMY